MNKSRINTEQEHIIESIPQKFKLLHGYGANPYLTPKDASNQFVSYIMHEENMGTALTQQVIQSSYIRGFIKLP